MRLFRTLALLAGALTLALASARAAPTPGIPKAATLSICPGATATAAQLCVNDGNGSTLPFLLFNPALHAVITPPIPAFPSFASLPNTAAVQALAQISMPLVVVRAGRITPGDGGSATLIYSPVACSAPDGGAQISPAGGGCYNLAASGSVSLRVWAGGGSADDTAAWTAALAWLGNQGGPATLVDDLPSSTVAGAARLVVPKQVTVRGGGTYEGADSSNFPNVTFTAATGGFTLLAGSAMERIGWTAGAANVDHLVELAGQVGIDHWRCSYTVSCIAMSRTLVAGQGTVNLSINTGSGLTNGTYTNVPFLGGGGSGSTLNVAVQSGTIIAASLVGTGANYAPWFDFGLAANALYQGSPAITAVGQIGTANTGRSRIRAGFGISNGATQTGLELDGAYDLVTVDDVEFWSPSGIRPPSIGFRFGHLDGCACDHLRAFGINTAVSWAAPTTGAQSFAALSSPEFDGVGYGVVLTFPLAHLTITGGYTRAIAKPLTVNAPTVDLTVSGHAFFANADLAIGLQDFKQASITGNDFESPQVNASLPQIYVGVGSGAQQGAANYYIGGNVFDGGRPGIVADATAKGGLVGPNRWPGRQYAATDGNGNATRGYFYAANGNTNVALATTGGQTSITANSSGSATLAWNLGYASSAVNLQFVGPCASAGYRPAITSIGTEGVTFTVLNAAGSAVPGAACALLFAA